ncbi:MAG: hypothetical protein RIQ52_496 [Pseudomonadota bacterium]
MYPYESTDNCYLKTHMTVITPRETGYVNDVRFEENQHVMAGDLLVVIDDSDFRTRVAAVQADIEVMKAQIGSLDADRKVQISRIQQQHSDIASAEADLDRARRDMQRFSNLVQQGAVSSQSHDSASATLKQTGAAHERALAAHAAAEGELAALDARIMEDRARIQSLETELALAMNALQHTRILAPMTGTIGNRSVQVGQMVKPGLSMAYLIPDDDIFAEANFKETQLEHMKPGQRVDIEIDAWPDTVFKGHVSSFAPASGSEFSLLPPENATGNFTKIVRRVPVHIALEAGSTDIRLRPGLSATAHVRVR